MSNRCGECGTSLPAEANFCPACGAAVAATGAPVSEMIKLVTILFGDVVGSTAQAERMNPEDTRELMAEFFEQMSDEIRKEGGTVERLIGDAIMADFGVPVSREDDAVRAVRAARAMHARLAAFNAGRPFELQVSMRIGVNTGEVSTGGSLGEQLLVMGDAVNVAARLEQVAQPGTVVIGERTARAVAHRFDLTPIEELKVKGKSGTLTAFVVGEERAEDRRRLDAPLVGRDDEIVKLEATLAATRRERRPHTVTIVGEAGVGKSRLKREFLSMLEPEARVLTGRCLPYGEGVTLWPLREILTDVAGIESSDPPERAAAKIEAVAAAAAEHAALSVAALASTLGLDLPAAGDELDPRELYKELVRAWRTLVSHIASGQTVVVVIEDFHWADRMLLDVLEEVMRDVHGPVMFLLPTRPDFVRAGAEWIAGISDYTAITLEPLSDEASARLMAEVAAPEGLPAELAERILGKAEGNPFFLEEIVHRLIDDGSIVIEDGVARVADDVSEIELPDTVQAAILTRLDLLPALDRNVTQQAAVVGRTFWAGSLAELTSVPELDQVLKTLKQRLMIAEHLTSSIDGESEYSFKHILIRDVAYQSLPRKSRGRAHETTARWIERIRGARADEAAELLTHHYEQAYRCLDEEPLRMHARRYALLAARAAVRKFAIQQAERFGRTAVDLSHGGDERVEALEALGDLYTLTFKSDGAWSAYLEALDELGDAATSRRTFAKLAGKAAIVPTRWRGSMRKPPAKDEIRSLIERGLACADDETPLEKSLLFSSKAFLLGLFELDPAAWEEGERLAGEAAELAEREAKPNLVSVAMDATMCCRAPTGIWSEIDEINRRRVGLIPRLRDAREACDAYSMAAYSSIRIGRYKDAADFATRCVDRAAGVDAGSFLQGLVWRLCALFMLGRWDEALGDHAAVERLQQESADEAPGSMTMRGHAAALLCRELRGDKVIVDRYLDVVIPFVRTRSVSSAGGGVEPDVARALAHRGEADAALDLLSIEPGRYQSVHLEAMCDVLARAPSDRARAVLDTARREEARAGLVPLGGFADRMEGRMALSEGDDQVAATRLARAADRFVQLSAPWEEAWSRLLLGEVLSRAAPRDADRELSLSLGIFQRLGSVGEAERAATLLAALGAS